MSVDACSGEYPVQPPRATREGWNLFNASIIMPRGDVGGGGGGGSGCCRGGAGMLEGGWEEEMLDADILWRVTVNVGSSAQSVSSLKAALAGS